VRGAITASSGLQAVRNVVVRFCILHTQTVNTQRDANLMYACTR
jgi:hypothetical protein